MDTCVLLYEVEGSRTFVDRRGFTEYNLAYTAQLYMNDKNKGGFTLGGHVPPSSLVALLPDSKASWENIGLYGVGIFFGFGERIKLAWC